MKKVIDKEDIRKANNIERCKLLIAIIKRTSGIYTRHKNTLKEKNMKDINIENYLSATKYTTRKELVEKTGLCDRDIRRKISELKKQRVVIYSSQRSGYRLAKEIRSMSKTEREEEIKLVEHSLNECKSRTKQLKKQMRKYIAYLKKAEQIVLEEDNYNHIPRID